MKTGIQLVKNLPPFETFRKPFRQGIISDLRGSEKEGIQEYKRIVENWSSKNRPDFISKISTKASTITWTIQVINADPSLPLWMWIDETGTREHDIVPKNKDFLFFEWGGPGSYIPKTTPGGGFGGPGTVRNGFLVKSKEGIHHPGFPPRRFSWTINPKLFVEFEGAILRGGAKGFKVWE